MSFMIERRVKDEVDSKHTTTDALFTSRHTTADSKLDTISSRVQDINLDTDSVESMLTTVQSQNTGIESKVDTSISEIGSKHDTTDSLLGTIDSKVDTLSSGDATASKQGTIVSEIDSKHSTSDTLLTSKATTIVSEVNVNESKVDTLQSNLDTMESKLDSLGGGDATASKQGTIVSEIDSKHSTSDTLLTSKATTIVSEVNVNESKVDSVKGSGFASTDSLKDIKAAVVAIQNNTSFTASVVPEMETPAAGSTDYALSINVYDGAGNMENPDLSTAFVKVVNPSGTSRNSNMYEDAAQTTPLTKIALYTYTGTPTIVPGDTYNSNNAVALTVIGEIATPKILVVSWSGVTAPDASGSLTQTSGTGSASISVSAVEADYAALQNIGTGRFEAFYNVTSSHAEENLRFTFSYYEIGVRRYYDRSSNVVDKISTATLDTIDSKVDTVISMVDTNEALITSKHAISDALQTSKHTTTQGEIGSKHATTDAEIDSKHATTDTLLTSKATTIVSEINVNESKIDTLSTGLGSTESKVDTAISEIDSKHSTSDTLLTSKATTIVSEINVNESKIDTLQSNLDTMESKIDTVSSGDATASKQDTIISMVDTNEALITSKHSTSDALVASKATTIVTEVNANESKISTISSAASDAFAQFEEVVFSKTTGTITVDGNDTEELSTTSSSQIAYNDTAIMASRIVGQGMGTKPVRGVYIDFGWTGSVTNGGGPATGASKWMVVAGSTATVTGAVDLTDEIIEGSTKTSRWRSGQIKLTPMNNLPFTAMLVGKVDNALDTLVCTGYAGSTITVVHELL